MSDTTTPVGGVAGKFRKMQLSLGDKKNRIAVVLVVLVALAAIIALAVWNPMKWSLPANTTVPQVNQVSLPAGVSQQDYDNLMAKANQLGDKKSLISSLFAEANKDGVITNQEWGIIMNQINDELNAVRSDSSDVMRSMIESARTTNARLETVAQNQQRTAETVNTLVDRVNNTTTRQQNSQTQTQVRATDTSQMNTSVQNQQALPSDNVSGGVSSATTGVFWKDWKNNTGRTLYARFMGVHWPAGGGPTVVQILPGKGLEQDGLVIHVGDHFVLYDTHNDGKDYTWRQVEADPSLGRYLNIDGTIVRYGYGRAMNVIDAKGNIFSGLAYKQGDSSADYNWLLNRRPRNGAITLGVALSTGELIPTLNFER